MSFEQLQPIFGYLAGALVPVTTVLYIISIFRGQVVPSRSTWIIWTILSCVLAGAAYMQGVLNAQMVMTAAGDLFVIVLAVKYGNWAGGKVDIVSGLIAGLAIALWFVTSNPLIAMILTLVAITVGFIPLAVALWNNPTFEKPLPWAIFALSTVFQMMALKEWTFASAIQPVVFLFLPVTIILLIYRPKIFGKT